MAQSIYYLFLYKESHTPKVTCHSGEDRNPLTTKSIGILAFAGMTKRSLPVNIRYYQVKRSRNGNQVRYFHTRSQFVNYKKVGKVG